MSLNRSLTGRSKKVLLTFGALGTAGAMAGMGTFATFTSTTSASAPESTGTVVVALGATGAATNRLTVGAAGLVPGDTVQRAFDLNNTGSQAMASITLTTTAAPSSLLDTDTTNGLQMVIDRCPAVWTEVGASAPFTYTCSSATSTVIATRPVIGATLPLGAISALTAGLGDHLRVTLTLPTGAGNTFQNLNSTIAYAFTGTQRAATNQ